MEELYKFEKLISFMDKKKYPTVKRGNGIEIVRVDLTQSENEGKIEFREDAIYLLHNNQWQKGYMYIKDADVSQYGLPKFHIFNCQMIENQKERGWFHGHYFWSNERLVDVKQRKSSKVYEQVNLSLCNYCRKMNNEQIDYTTTEGFYNLLDIQEEVYDYSEVEVDIFGYTRDWNQISKKFRIENNFICNVCNNDLSNEKRFLEVHHINGEKRNNKRENLECRCIYCHVLTDNIHLNNYKKNKSRQITMNKYLEKYGEYLKLALNKENL